MGGVGNGSMGFPPKMEPLPMTENADGSIGVDLSNLENPDETISASVDWVAKYCRRKMGFDKIQHAEFPYIVLKEDKVQVASDGTLMQRGTIASSSNPVNPICSQNYLNQFHCNQSGAPWVVVPPPWGTACEPGPGFQHSSQPGFPPGPAGMGNAGNEASGLQGLSASENELHEVASDVTMMPRGTIASSSNPVNPICSQTPGGTPWGAVPPPWETACEPGPGFQHSSQPGFPPGPAGMGNAGNEASGLQGFAAGLDIQVVTRRPRSANKSKRPSTRPRGSVFKDEEKGSLLQFMLEYLQDPDNEGQFHAWLLPVTKKMKAHSHVRDRSESWRGLWETLIKNLDAMKRRFREGTTGYWDLTMDQKIARKKDDCHFPLTFEPEWVAAMENIWKIKPRKEKPTGAPKKRIRRDGQEVSTVTGSAANFAGAGSSDANNQASGQHPTQAGAQGSHEDLQLANQQTPGALQSAIQDLSSFQSLGKEDNQDIFAMREEQVAVQTELDKISLDFSEDFDFDAFSAQNPHSESAVADQAGGNPLENEE